MPPFRHIPRIANNLKNICKISCNGHRLTLHDKAGQNSCGEIRDGKHGNRPWVLQRLREKGVSDSHPARAIRSLRFNGSDPWSLGLCLGNRHPLPASIPVFNLRENLPQVYLFLICRIYDTRSPAFWVYVVRFGYLVLFACLRKGLPFGGLRRYFARFPVFRAFDTLGVTGSNPVAPNLQKPRENDGFSFPGVNPKRRKIPKMCRKSTTNG